MTSPVCTGGKRADPGGEQGAAVGQHAPVEQPVREVLGGRGYHTIDTTARRTLVGEEPEAFHGSTWFLEVGGRQGHRNGRHRDTLAQGQRRPGLGILQSEELGRIYPN